VGVFAGISCAGAGKTGGVGGGERGASGFGSWARGLSLAFPLPPALPLMNGYSGYEQHPSGKAAPLLGCGLWPSKALLGLGLLCVWWWKAALTLLPGLGEALLRVWEVPRALEHIRRVFKLSRDTSCLVSWDCGPGVGGCLGVLGSGVPLAGGDLPAAREVWSKGRRKGSSIGSCCLLVSAATRLSAGEDAF